MFRGESIKIFDSRVVVTGMGMLCPLGKDLAETWDGLVNARSGIDYITLFDTAGYLTKFAGEVKGFQVALVRGHAEPWSEEEHLVHAHLKVHDVPPVQPELALQEARDLAALRHLVVQPGPQVRHLKDALYGQELEVQTLLPAASVLTGRA